MVLMTALTSRTIAASDGCGTSTVQLLVANILGSARLDQHLPHFNDHCLRGKRVCLKAFGSLLGIGSNRLLGLVHGKVDMRRTLPGTACSSVFDRFHAIPRNVFLFTGIGQTRCTGSASRNSAKECGVHLSG